MIIETVEIGSLVPDPANARKHDQKNLDSIKGSLVKFKQQKPLVVNDQNIIIAGNGTYAAAKELGWTHIDIVRSELDKFDQIGFALADNRTSDLSDWDESVLSQSLHSLREIDFDLSAIGFDTSYLDNLNDVLNPKPPEGAKELSESEFQDFDKKCPRCGFEFDEPSST